MKLIQIFLITFAIALLSACNDKKEEIANISSPSPISNFAEPLPDVGKVDTVQTKATGYGSTVAIATSDAMKYAILQVNGATIDSGSVQVKYGLDITDGQDSLSIRATEFAELVAQKSGGAITNFKILEVLEPKEKGGLYKVHIAANIAHFTAPLESKKIKVVLTPVLVSKDSFEVGSDNINAQKVADDIRLQVSAALTNTGRFSVLDRELDADINSELEMIESGTAPKSEVGKLGQAVSADVIWAGTVNTLAYIRNVRKLQTSRRELVSYSGGWVVSQKLVNVATRQIMLSDTLEGKAPDIEPTTMSNGINSNQVLQNMTKEIVNEIVESILIRTFPITVVSRDDNSVILSQGGQSIQVGNRYSLVAMGKELKDPQTGESLGRVESQCCEVIIDKVSTKLAYGHLENIKMSLNELPIGGLQLREKIISSKTELAEADENEVTTNKSNPKKLIKKESKLIAEEDFKKDFEEDEKW